MRCALLLLIFCAGCGEDATTVPLDMAAAADQATSSMGYPFDMFPAECAACLQAQCGAHCTTNPPSLECGRCIHNVATPAGDGGTCDFPVYGCGSCSSSCPAI
jgi:hypothetical protein